MKFTPLAATRTSASPAAGTGVGVSFNTNCSGPPGRSTWMLFMQNRFYACVVRSQRRLASVAAGDVTMLLRRHKSRSPTTSPRARGEHVIHAVGENGAGRDGNRIVESR